MRCTSSTPASAARSSTASITRWRMSGRRIGGSGSEMSSKAIVSFMPGKQQRGQRLAVAERVEAGRGGWRRRCPRAARAARAGRSPVCRPAGSFSSRKPSPWQNSDRRRRAVDVEDEPGAGHQRFRSFSSRGGRTRSSRRRGAPALAACSMALRGSGRRRIGGATTSRPSCSACGRSSNGDGRTCGAVA